LKDLLLPLIGLAIPGLAESTYVVELGSQKFSIGDFLVALITFIIVAVVVFVFVKIAKKWHLD
jgi:large conductance mechanosensitive channel